MIYISGLHGTQKIPCSCDINFGEVLSMIFFVRSNDDSLKSVVSAGVFAESTIFITRYLFISQKQRFYSLQ